MKQRIRIRDVTVELLRSGPSHGQLLSPLTLYLGICDEAEAGLVTLPFEHHRFLRRVGVLRYDDSKAADKMPELREMGVEMARVLGSIPRLAGSISADSGVDDTLVHLSLVLSAAELALLPFELAKMPLGPAQCTESWLALQSRVPVVITRRTRNVATRDFQWLKQPRVLFISANADPKASDGVPFAEHRLAMIAAVRPFMFPEDRHAVVEAEGRREQFGNRLTILREPRVDDIVAECRENRYTHIHVLAHGDTDATLGDRSFGLRLHPRDGVISGERLASAITCMADGNIHRPDVVTLATCDSANSTEAVLAPGASIAHVLHQAGVPLVVASQFPLSKRGSVLVAREFYSGLLWGEHPWVLMHRVRMALHGTQGHGDHDWASLVVYEALRLDNYQLDQARYLQCEQAMEAAWADDDGWEDELPEEGQTGLGTRLKAGDWKTDLVMRQLPLESRYFGMRAHALKGDGLMRDAIDTMYQVDEARRRRDAVGEFTERVADCCAQLEEASDAYEFAVNGFLTKDGQGMNAPYRSLLALLRLQAVLGQPSPEGAWETALFWIQTMVRDVKQLDERQWASACLCELHLLQLLRPGDVDRRRGDIEARRAAVALERLDRQWVSPARQWLLVQLDAYIKFWGDPRFEATLRGFRGNVRVSFGQGTRNLMTTARAVSKLLDRPDLRERAHVAKLPSALSAQKAREAATVLQPVPAASATVRAEAQASGAHLGAKPAAAKPALALAVAAKTKPALAEANKTQATTASVTAAKLAKPAKGAKRAKGTKTAKAAEAVKSDAYVRVDMLPARHGDCLWIEYGRGNSKPSRVLIDCGPKGSDDELRRRIEALPPEERAFELFILSHIDDDHIGAAITLLKDAKALKLRFGDVWFNGWRHISGHLNAAQGEAFSALLEREGLPWNAMVDGAAMVREVDTLPEFTLPGGMKLTLLSPTPDRLKALARSWKREVGDLAGQAEAGSKYLGRVPSSSEDVDALAAMPFESDTTAANGSSIAVLAEFGGYSLLLGADAHAPAVPPAWHRRLEDRRLQVAAPRQPEQRQHAAAGAAAVPALPGFHQRQALQPPRPRGHGTRHRPWPQDGPARDAVVQLPRRRTAERGVGQGGAEGAVRLRHGVPGGRRRFHALRAARALMFQPRGALIVTPGTSGIPTTGMWPTRPFFSAGRLAGA